MKKVIRDGKVAIIYAPDFGTGWYTENNKHKELMYHPEIVKKIEEDKQDEITIEWLRELLEIDSEEYINILAIGDLEIKWLLIGTKFYISEYDGSEDFVLQERLIETA